MKRMIFAVCLIFAVVFGVSCKGSPTVPTPPASTVQSITVSSASTMLYIGATETFTATATMSDGSTKAVTSGVWRTDNTNIATVNSTGLVTIVGSGTVNIVVTYGGKQGSKSIRGLPNYQGTWTGTYRVDSCTATGYFYAEGFCDFFTVGMVLPTNLVLTQNQDQVTGRFYYGVDQEGSADAVGSVGTNGQLLLTGRVEWEPFTIDVAWQLQSTTPGQITGTLNHLYLGTGYSGSGQLWCIINYLKRTSLVLNEPSFAGLRLTTPTLKDLLRAMVGR